jgi:hypothetical protein
MMTLRDLDNQENRRARNLVTAARDVLGSEVLVNEPRRI